MREELQKEFNEQFENHKRNVENWEKQKELEQEKIEKEHNDKLKKIEEEKLSLENLKEYCRTHDLYELKKQQSFLDNSITLKMKTLDNMDKEIKSLEIKSCNIKNKLAQYTQEDNQKIADLKEYKEKKEEVKNILNTVDEKNKELENINKNIAEKSKELEDINKNITDKNKQITELDNTIKTKENEIEKAEKTLFDYGMQETKLIDKINDYKDKNEYIDIIKNRFISNAAKLIANKTDFSFGKSSSLVEKNINTVFVNTITSEWDKQNYDNIDVNKILKSLNYKDKKETKDTVKNDYTSYYDDYNK